MVLFLVFFLVEKRTIISVKSDSKHSISKIHRDKGWFILNSSFFRHFSPSQVNAVVCRVHLHPTFWQSAIRTLHPSVHWQERQAGPIAVVGPDLALSVLVASYSNHLCVQPLTVGYKRTTSHSLVPHCNHILSLPPPVSPLVTTTG